MSGATPDSSWEWSNLAGPMLVQRSGPTMEPSPPETTTSRELYPATQRATE